MAYFDELLQRAITVRNNVAPSSNTAILVGGVLVSIVSALQLLLDTKQDDLTFDTAPTDGSTNPVTSDGIYEAIAEALASIDLSACEKIINKVTSINAQSTNVQYPTAKCLYDSLQALANEYAAKVHTHDIADVEQLQETLDNKATLIHNHNNYPVSGRISDGGQSVQEGILFYNHLGNIIFTVPFTLELKFNNGMLTLLRNNSMMAHNGIFASDIVGAATDNYLDPNSERPLQNKVILNALNGKSNNGHTHSYNNLTDKPTIPAAVTIDSALSASSTNPVQNKVVKSALDGKSNNGHTHSYNDLTNKPTIPAAVTVDSALSTTSTNPVQNKVVKSALDGKAASSHTHSQYLTTHQTIATIAVITIATGNANIVNIQGTKLSIVSFSITTSEFKVRFGQSKRYIIYPTGKGYTASPSATYDKYGVSKLGYSGNTNSSYTAQYSANTASYYAKVCGTWDTTALMQFIVIGY